MHFKYFKKVIICILVCLQVSHNQQSSCVSFAMYLKFFGSLQEDRAKSLWEIDAETVESAMYQCVRRCESDQRCVGIEICTIRPDLSRCRGCCEWYVIDKDEGLSRNDTDGCRYLELNKDSVESRGTRLSGSSNMSVVASSTSNGYPASNALDGIYNTSCNANNLYVSGYESNPWLEVTWRETITIWRIIIYNCCGVGFVLNVTYSNNGTGVTDTCGFYPGLLSREGDRVSFYCPPEARATTVKVQFQSKPGQKNYLIFCEIEIYQED